MNREQMGEKLAAQLSLSKKSANEILVALFDPSEGVLAEALLTEGKLVVHGFGSFKVSRKAARTVTAFGKTVDVPAKKKVGFKASKNLRDRVQAAGG